MVAEEIVNGSLRRRKNDTKVEQVSNETSVKEEVVWGKTPGGIVFRVPTTHDVLTTLFHPLHQKSYLDLLSLSTLALQLFLFFVLPKRAAQIFFLFYVALWRAAYDAGLGWILTKQSKKKWIVREVQRRGWLDENRRPAVRAWIRNELAGKMGKDYNFDDLPLEYNTWLLFRQAVDIILINDFLAYVLFAFTCFRVPENLSLLVHILRWIGGITLIAFNIWVKMEAHHIVKDYGWYWGDVFFERGALVFDGVFEMAPHPMYSVGYAGYYGLSMIAGSYPVLFVSLAIHAAQFGFLVCFENPHIERMYGQRKPIALRTPLFSNRNRALSQSSTTSSAVASTGVSAESSQSISSILEIATAESSKARPQTRNRRHHKASFSISSSVEGSTPAITDAGSSLDAETEVETELDEDEVLDANGGSSSGGTIDAGGPPSKMKSRTAQRLATITQYDLMNKYFRKDVVGLKNIDLLRASDLKLLLAISYTLFNSFIGGSLTHKQGLVLHFLHAFGWRMFHSFGLGLLLKRQSESKFLVRHFVKNYYYPPGTAAEGAVEEAFSNWKSMYNLSLWMTYGSFIGLAWRTYQAPSSFSDLMTGDLLLRHTLGVMMIALHVWTALECYEVLGVFGWFFGDFFIEDYPSQLDYTGIYRFLNNPERTMSGAAFFGLALISGSKLVFTLAVISQLSHWWFLSNVENPHMQKLYGDSLRKEAGLTKTIKNVALKNQALRNSVNNPQVQQFAQSVGSAAEVVESFLTKSIKDGEDFLQTHGQLLSFEHLVLPLVTNSIGDLDMTKYEMAVVPTNPDGELRFHLGEPIVVKWRAPTSHSRRDWIGLYRVGANKSSNVTNTNSLGLWTPVHDEEWDGDVPLGEHRTSRPGKDMDCGEVVFKRDTLPWQTGKYEIRYHHEGKYNVMSCVGPIEIYVDKPAVMDFNSVRSSLMKIVNLCLDGDPSLLPLSAQQSFSPSQVTSDNDELTIGDPDDFRFWNQRQAKRICASIKQAFEVEYAPEVVLADANISALANRILASREMFSS